MSDADRWRVAPGATVDLTAIDPGSTDGAPGDGDGDETKETTKATFKDLRHELRDLQTRLWAEHEQALLVVLQAMDAGGKDGTVKHVFRGANPMGIRVTSFKKPSEDELDHDFLWRVHKVTPAKGEIGVFNRSHYEDVLVARVHELVPERRWRPRFETIRAFEDGLTRSGTRVIKVYLHISKDEQKERFDARRENPVKRWKWNDQDLVERKRWDDYRAAYEEAIAATSTEAAPWYVVPADHKWYRNWAVSRILIETLQDMNPQFPTETR
jgi:PPK2 family polyphosphate:nucleotide phosphotransferase